MVDNTEYTVADIETEHTYHTKYGDYRPDIVVTTTIGKTFIFEIKYSNKKATEYIPKWDEIGFDVVEVDARYFINQRVKGTIPKFSLIYSDGECYIKTYSRPDYDSSIAKRKLEWKRQDKINYKIQWERLDWFWNRLCKYKYQECEDTDVIDSFCSMDCEDKVWCYENIKRKTCVEFKQQFQDIINKDFLDRIDSALTKYPDIKITSGHVSPLIWEIRCTVYQDYCGYKLHQSVSDRFRTEKRNFNIDSSALNLISNAKGLKLSLQRKISAINKLSEIQFVDHILPQSHYATETYDFDDIYFSVEFISHIHNKYILENIGSESYYKFSDLSYDRLMAKCNQLKANAIEKMDNEFIEYIALNHLEYIKEIEALSKICQETGFLEIRHGENYEWVALINTYKCYHIANFKVAPKSNLTNLPNDLHDIFISAINEAKKNHKKENIVIGYLNKYAALINNCSNGMWLATVSQKNLNLQISFIADKDNYHGRKSEYCIFNINDNENSIMKKIRETMNSLLTCAKGGFNDYRIMEARE